MNKMLIVEDDPVYTALITTHFEGLFDEIVSCANWSEAAEYLNDDTVIVYWIDIYVPGHGEAETMLRVADIRKQKNLATILVVTGDPSSHLEATALKAGADHFVHKMDAVTRKQVIACVMLAMLRAQGRGADVTKFLEKAQQLLQSEPNTNTLAA